MENKEKLFLMSLSFGLGISKLLLALTTAIFVYPTVSGKVTELGYSETWAILAGVVASVIIALSIDGLAGLFYPDGLTGLIAKRKGRFLYVAITIIGLALYAASGTFSIWMAPMVSDIVVSEPKDSSMVLYDRETETYNQGFNALSERVQIARYELSEAEKSADLSYLADHPNPNVKKQLLSYIRSGVNTWAAQENVNNIRTKVRRERRKSDKRIQTAQKKLDAALLAQSNYIEQASARRDAKQIELKSTETALRTEYINEKAQAKNIVIWIDIIMLFIIVFANPIRIYYAKINGEELPTSRSIAYAFYLVGVAFTNRFASVIYWLESKINFDINQDGVTGKPKESTTPKPNQETSILSPIRHATQFDGVELQRRLEVEVGAIRNDLEKDLEVLRRENLELKQAKKSKPKKSKSTQTPFSPKAPTVENSKLVAIDTIKGFQNLEQNARLELMQFSKKVLNEKHSLEKLSKSTRNAFTASYKAGTKPTQAKNKVKFLWLANVLKTHGQEVSTQKGKIKIKSV
jgi:hypothetical protein